MLETHTSRRIATRRFSRGAGVVILGAFVLVAGSEGTQTAQANGDTRTITLRHMHRGDQITVTFKRNGRYDANGLKQLSHFLRDWRNDKSTRMEPKLFDIVWETHREVGRGQLINIVSAYRSPETNAMLRSRSRGVAKFSQHMLGRAMDFYINGVAVSQIREAGVRLQRGGVGFYPTSGRPFVHLDAGNVRAWPRLSRQQLAKLFPTGKTVHVPTDGKPLAGYQVAMAELKARGNVTSEVAYASTSASRGKSLFARLFGGGDEDETEIAPTMVAQAPVARPARDDGAVARPTRGAPVAAPVPAVAPAAAPSAPEPAIEPAARTLVARVPLPLSRPADIGRGVEEIVVAAAQVPLPPVAPARAASVVQVASATPAAVPTPPETDAEPEIIPFQVASAAPAAAADEPTRGPDMVWRAGAQPLRAGSQSGVQDGVVAHAAEPAMALVATIPAPRPRPAGPETSAVAVLAAIPTPVANDRTASLGLRPRQIDPQAATAYQAEAATFPRLPDAFLARKAPAVPAPVVLAYAAPQSAELPLARPAPAAAPQKRLPVAGTIVDGVRVIAADATPSAIYAAATSRKAAVLAASGPMVTARLDDRTMRAVATPARAVRDPGAKMIHPDQAHMASLIVAPTAALAGGFGVDPSHGARTDRFGGSSVMLLRTQSFAPSASVTAEGPRRTRG